MWIHSITSNKKKLFIYRSIRRVQNQQIRTRLNSPPIPPAELPIPQTSTLRSRRRLANILVVAGFVFMACWSPHVICLIFREFSITSGCSNTVTEFVMLLGNKINHIENWLRFKFPQWFYWHFLLSFFCFFYLKLFRICTFSRIANTSLGSQL